ncbi:MAG: cadmium resistance transporter, partial [Methylocella sp.]
VDLRYLGLIPLTLGAWQLVQLMMGRGKDESGEPDKTPGPIGLAAYSGFALVLLANSSDSVGIMTPLFADLKPAFVLTCFAAAVATAILMASLANYLARHPATRTFVEKTGKWVLPFLLIGIGLLIFTDKPADIFLE